jgi:hypothetical protein
MRQQTQIQQASRLLELGKGRLRLGNKLSAKLKRYATGKRKDPNPPKPVVIDKPSFASLTRKEAARCLAMPAMSHKTSIPIPAVAFVKPSLDVAGQCAEFRKRTRMRQVVSFDGRRVMDARSHKGQLQIRLQAGPEWINVSNLF